MPFVMQIPTSKPPACLVASSAAIHGTVRDTTGALIPKATLILDGVRLQSGADGNFQFQCSSPGAHTLSIQADVLNLAQSKYLLHTTKCLK